MRCFRNFCWFAYVELSAAGKAICRYLLLAGDPLSRRGTIPRTSVLSQVWIRARHRGLGLSTSSAGFGSDLPDCHYTLLGSGVDSGRWSLDTVVCNIYTVPFPVNTLPFTIHFIEHSILSVYIPYVLASLLRGPYDQRMLLSQLFALLALDATVCLSQKVAHISELSMAPCKPLGVDVDISSIYDCSDDSASEAVLNNKGKSLNSQLLFTEVNFLIGTSTLLVYSSGSSPHNTISKSHPSSPSTTQVLASIPPAHSSTSKKLSAIELFLVVSAAPIIFAALLSVYTQARRIILQSQGVFHPGNIVPAGCYDDSDDTLIDDKVDVTTLSQLLKYADEAQNESSVSATGSRDIFS